jgi:Kef-type K+ transport system membrane component KefB
MKANLLLSTMVAITGIAAPMGLSFVLGPLVGATSIQAFSAGAALCSTSLGTTFTVLSTSGLTSTRLGSILSTAAMMDDVVGLVMVQVVSSLDPGAVSTISPSIIVRPLVVSLAFGILLPIAFRFVLRPLMKAIDKQVQRSPNSRVARLFAKHHTPWLIRTGFLLALLTGASFAGASVLLAAYLAGITISWWDEQRELTTSNPAGQSRLESVASGASSASSTSNGNNDSTAIEQPRLHEAYFTGPSMFESYYAQVNDCILKPFFFVSIRTPRF